MILFIKPPVSRPYEISLSAREQPQAIRCDSLRLSVIFDYGIPPWGSFHVEGDVICINSKNVSCLDCCGWELYGSINNDFWDIRQ